MAHRIAIAGASGRMGQTLIEAVRAADDCVLAGALDVATSPSLGQDPGAFAGMVTGVRTTSDLSLGLQDSEVLIDFTRPEGTMAHLAACRAMGVALVIGTTGFSEVQKAQIAEAAKHIPIMMAPNMSVGVNVTMKLLAMAAPVTTLKSSRPTTATRWMPPRAPPSRWARSSHRPWAATSKIAQSMPAKV
jgi:4-hydroxy-tetrahydrodipicolinate reductase